MELLELNVRYQGDNPADAVLLLPFAIRQKSRFRSQCTDGREVGVKIERGGVLRHGDRLSGPDGTVVLVEALPEPVSTVSHDDIETLSRVAYHLGNRHVPLQVGAGWLRYRADHVLDDLCQTLGVGVHHEDSPFEPEAGAYGGGHHHH